MCVVCSGRLSLSLFAGVEMDFQYEWPRKYFFLYFIYFFECVCMGSLRRFMKISVSHAREGKTYKKKILINLFAFAFKTSTFPSLSLPNTYLKSPQTLRAASKQTHTGRRCSQAERRRTTTTYREKISEKERKF